MKNENTLTTEPSSESPSFASLGLDPLLLRAIGKAGYEQPTPIQAQAIPAALNGRDVLGCARTGTGKTAAYVLPILHQLLHTAHPTAPRLMGRNGRRPQPSCSARTLILAPTRELAAQIGDSVRTYGKGSNLRHVVVYGGVRQGAQVRELRRGVDMVIATPGRLCDLAAQDHIDLSGISMFVLDEFDRMLDQGFLPAIRRVVGMLPKQRQTFLFSATTPPSLEPMVRSLLRDPVRISVAKQSSTPVQITQSVWFLEPSAKRAALDSLLREPDVTRALVFTRTKRGANRVATVLAGAGIVADAIHGNKSQNARQRTLNRFRGGALQVLVATDVAARGLDVDDVSHVVNYDMPDDPESYVHRIGRTARGGAFGAAISFCTAAERSTLSRIERLISQPISDHPRSSSQRPKRVA